MKKLVGVGLASLVGLVLVGLAVAGANRNYSVHLNGAMEVPVRDTDAQGQAIFHLAKDGQSIDYKLIVANIENVTQAHIHRIENENRTGGIVVWLYPEAPPAVLIPGRSDGPLEEGTITADDLRGSLAGGTLEDLLELLNTGQAYVNVHTSQFPPGEIRGDF